MEQEDTKKSVMVVKLVKGKVSGMQTFSLKEGSTLQPLLENKCFTTLNTSLVYSRVPQDVHRKEENKSMWRRCTCGMTFIYQDNPLVVSASFQRCRFCCKAFHDIKCLEKHIASVHKTLKKCSSELCTGIDNSIITNSATISENQTEKVENSRALGRYHKCHYCKQSFHRVTSLESHLATVHRNIKSCPCGSCNQSFQDVSSKESSKITSNLVDNDMCHEKMEKSNQKAYKGLKSYKCAFCTKTFIRKALLLEHESTHTSGKNVLCEKCGKMISSLKLLRGHFVSHHREKSFACDFCGKLFVDVSKLKRHLLIHTQEKPHYCHKCGKYFAKKYTLKMHLRVHNNFKPNVCKICNKAFCQSTNLKYHMRIHGIFFRRRAKNEKEVFDELQKTIIPIQLDNSG